jgi:hypothetical protein
LLSSDFTRRPPRCAAPTITVLLATTGGVKATSRRFPIDDLVVIELQIDDAALPEARNGKFAALSAISR